MIQMLLLPFIIKEINTIHNFIVDTFQPVTEKLIQLAAMLPQTFFTVSTSRLYIVFTL